MKKENQYLRDKIDRIVYHTKAVTSPSSFNQQRQVDSLREMNRKRTVPRIQSRPLQTHSKPFQRLVTEAVYRPPVCPTCIPYHHKKQAYQRFKRPNHRPKLSKSTIDWRTQAKESHYERLTPVWASKVRTYPDKYNPSIACHLDVKLRNNNYHPSALDSAAISTLELMTKTHNNPSLRKKSGNLFNHLNNIHRERLVSNYPSVVPSLWETDCYQQSNRQVQELCDKLGTFHLPNLDCRDDYYQLPYKWYLNHRLNLLCHCHGGKQKYKKHT